MKLRLARYALFAILLAGMAAAYRLEDPLGGMILFLDGMCLQLALGIVCRYDLEDLLISEFFGVLSLAAAVLWWREASVISLFGAGTALAGLVIGVGTAIRSRSAAREG
jgi:hypothetical protein